MVQSGPGTVGTGKRPKDVDIVVLSGLLVETMSSLVLEKVDEKGKGTPVVENMKSSRVHTV